MNSRVPIGAAIGMLLLAAFGRWPYGFYQLLRLVVCGASTYAAVEFAQTSKARMWLLIAAAIVFNPLAPIHLTRQQWAPINLVTAAALAAVLISSRTGMR